MTSPLTLRSSTAADAASLERLAALDSARPLTGEVMLAHAGGDVRAALSLETGRVVADPSIRALSSSSCSARPPATARAAAAAAAPRAWHARRSHN